MKRTVTVWLGDSARQVGALRFDAQGARHSAGVEYHPDWLEANDAFAIEPSERELDQFADAFEHPERNSAKALVKATR
jgi:hypothetical protein